MNGNIYGIKTSFHYRQVFGRKPDESIVLMSASLFSYFAFIVDAASSHPKKKSFPELEPGDMPACCHASPLKFLFLLVK
jgi:hypothetical protein